MTSAAAGSIWFKCIEEKIDAQQQPDERVLAVRRPNVRRPGPIVAKTLAERAFRGPVVAVRAGGM
jgi:hypothetical protein